MLDIKNRETLEIYVLGDDFKFYQNLKYLPLTSYPSNNQSALIIEEFFKLKYCSTVVYMVPRALFCRK